MIAPETTMLGVKTGETVFHLKGGTGLGPADGRLIAAAPELLAAVRAMLPIVVNESPGGCRGEFPETCEHCAAIVKARAAIAKATGQL